MRDLLPAPRVFVDPVTRAPAFGSYFGPLPRVRLDSGSRLRRALREKRWVFVAFASESIWISLGIVATGYASTAFVYAFDRTTGRMLVDRTTLGSLRAAAVADDVHADGVVARFDTRSVRVSLERRGTSLHVVAQLSELAVDAVLDEAKAPPPIAAIASLGPALTSATEKRVLASVRGHSVIGGRRISLDDAMAGYDYTHGFLPRRTRWKWAFAMGHDTSGRRIGFNVVEGFVGEAECAVFVDECIHPLPEPHFTFDPTDPSRPWRLQGKGIDLHFDVGAVHAQRTNLLVVRSRFLQPVGAFRGTLEVADARFSLEGVSGVVEDQDVVW